MDVMCLGVSADMLMVSVVLLNRELAYICYRAVHTIQSQLKRFRFLQDGEKGIVGVIVGVMLSILL